MFTPHFNTHDSPYQLNCSRGLREVTSLSTNMPLATLYTPQTHLQSHHTLYQHPFSHTTHLQLYALHFIVISISTLHPSMQHPFTTIAIPLYSNTTFNQHPCNHTNTPLATLHPTILTYTSDHIAPYQHPKTHHIPRQPTPHTTNTPLAPLDPPTIHPPSSRPTTPH